MKKSDLRTTIIKSATRLFANKGFYETTVDDIARASKIAKGTVYLYFKDKPSIYISIIEEHFKTGIKYLGEIQGKELTNTEKLQNIAERWIDYMLKFESSFPMFSLENINLTQKIMRTLKPMLFLHIKEIIVIIAQIIKNGINKKEFRKVNPDVAALHFLNTIRTGFFARFFIGSTVDKNTAVQLFFEGLRKRR